MKTLFSALVMVVAAASVGAEPVTVLNALPSRPVFTIQTASSTVTRTVAPGQRAQMEAGLFSGLGEKAIALTGGSTYYLARFGALPGLYLLAAHQSLVLNQSGQPVSIVLSGERAASGVLAVGALALGGRGPEGSMTLEWDDGSGEKKSAVLEGGRVYRLVLDSPEGTGTTVSLIPWG